MFLQLQQESLLIGKRPAGFTEHYYTEWDDGLGKEKIALFMVLSVGSTQVPGSEVGKEAFQLLQDHFLHDLSGDPYDRFESALREINLMVNQKEKEVDLKFIPNLNMICGVIQKDLLFLSQRGEARGYLIRKRHVSSITDELYDERNKEDLFQNIASGILEVGDTLVFTTTPLIQYVTPSDLSKIFSEQSLAEAGKEIRDLLHMDLEDQLALLSFEVLEKTEVVEAPAQATIKLAEIEEETRPKERSQAREQLVSSLKVLRNWVSHEDRWRFLDRVRQMERSKLLKLVIAIAVVLVVGLFILSRDGETKKQLEAMTTQLATAEDYVAEAGTKGTFDKDAARELLSEAETLTKEVLNSGFLQADAQSLLDEIDEQRDVLDNIVHVDKDLTLLADLSDVLEDGSIHGVVLQGGKHVVYTGSEIYEVLIDEVQEPTALDSTETVLGGSFFADQDKVVLLLADGSLVEYADSNAQFADSSDGTWKQGSALATYSSRVYILDSEAGQIWKIQRGNDAYGTPQAYVDPEKVDLAGAVSLAIDGKVWVLQDNGSILQLLSGEAVDFDVKNAPSTSMEGSTKIWADAESDEVFVLDPVRSALLVFTKDPKTDNLIYSTQFVFDELKGELKDFYFDQDREVVVLVTETALYEMPL